MKHLRRLYLGLRFSVFPLLFAGGMVGVFWLVEHLPKYMKFSVYAALAGLIWCIIAYDLGRSLE